MKKNRFLSFLFLTVLSLPLAACGGTSGDGIRQVEGPHVNIHYQRSDNQYDKWALWLWDFPSGTGNEYAFNGKDTYGACATYTFTELGGEMASLGFIVKSKGSWASKDPDGDRSVTFADLQADENQGYHIYLKSGDETVYLDASGSINEAVETVKFINETTILCITNTPVVSYQLLENDVVIGEETFDTPKTTFRPTLPNGQEASFDNSYKVKVTFESGKVLTSVVNTNTLFKTDSFGTKYNYDGELGAIYTKEKTTFKVWSPVSSSIKLRIYTGPHKEISTSYQEFDMVKGEKGVFSYELSGDQEGKYYTYVVTNASYEEKEIVDPYAKSAGLNGERGMIVDFSKTNPEGWDEVAPHPYDRKSLVIYETHVSDVTSSETWRGTEANAKRFKGMYEEGTTYTSEGVTVSTGFDHIKELGVNAVQLIPIFDQANDELKIKTEFNWGYNPLNYNVLEGKYASNPIDGYTRIKEFKELVQSYNKAGINIIMDVVYNHVNSALGSNFDVLMPGYYYRYNAKNELNNGSGCGNETASEMYMMRKFIVDSTSFWASEYKLGGFRFDLMGLHDLTTMETCATQLKTIFPEIYICGEPWCGGTSALDEARSAVQKNGNLFEGYGAFNDQMRDALIKGGLSGDSELGWITNSENMISDEDIQRLTRGITGRTYLSLTKSIRDPNKVTNYVTCHDNYTLYDRIVATGQDLDEETIEKQAMLANSIVLTSQATSFLLAGEEFLRTKDGDSNSYTSSYKVNELDYSLKVKHPEMMNNYQKLIALKKSFAGLHFGEEEVKNIDVQISEDSSIIKYTLTAEGKTYIFVHANGLNKNASVDLSGYTLYHSTLGDVALSANTTIRPYETIIGYKNS